MYNLFNCQTVDSANKPDFAIVYKDVITELECLLKLDFDVVSKKDVSTVDSQIKDVYSILCDADSGTLNEIYEVILATSRSSLIVLHDFIEKAVLSKLKSIATFCKILHIKSYIFPL